MKFSFDFCSIKSTFRLTENTKSLHHVRNLLGCFVSSTIINHPPSTYVCTFFMEREERWKLNIYFCNRESWSNFSKHRLNGRFKWLTFDEYFPRYDSHSSFWIFKAILNDKTTINSSISSINSRKEILFYH